MRATVMSSFVRTLRAPLVEAADRDVRAAS